MNEQEKIAQVLRDASAALEKTAAERDTAVANVVELETKLAKVNTRLEAEKIAAEMHDKGINTDQEFGSLVSDLVKAANEGRLPVIAEAVKMSSHNMGQKIASINHDEMSAEGLSELEAFIVGSVG